jgi:hypothetical protein
MPDLRSMLRIHNGIYDIDNVLVAGSLHNTSMPFAILHG